MQRGRRSFRLLATNTEKLSTKKFPGNKHQTETQDLDKNCATDNAILNSSPQERALGNYLVLTNIVKNLRTCDVINCRLVDSAWTETANLILRTREDIKVIHIQYHETKNKFLLNSHRYHELSELKNILEKSASFPCHRFKIEGQLDRRGLQNFLSSSRCASQIKQLNLNFSTRIPKGHYRKESIANLRKLLVEQLPNLQCLTLFTIRLTPEENSVTEKKLFPSTVVLPALTHFEVNHYSGNWYEAPDRVLELGWTGEILSSAPNLKSFSTFDIKDDTLNALVKFQKTHLLTKIMLDRETEYFNDDRILAQFKITELTEDRNLNQNGYNNLYIERRGNPSIRPFQQLLNLNADTLTSISLEYIDAASSLQTKHVFQHVKTFRLIGLEIKAVEGQGSNKIDLQTCFPNLEKLCLQGGFNESENDFRYKEEFPFFHSAEPMEKVKTLEIQNVCSVGWLKLLPQVFPKVTHLVLENYWDFARSGRLFWSFTSVKSMKLGILLGAANLDSVFTGFSAETCKRLRNNSRRALRQLSDMKTMDIETEAEIEELRVAPSIVQCKDLKELQIKVADTDPYVQLPPRIQCQVYRRLKERWKPSFSPSNVDLISPVSSIYALGMMPSLQRVEIFLTPNETKFIPMDKRSIGWLNKMAARLKPMAAHPRVTLHPIQMNNGGFHKPFHILGVL